MSRRIIFRGKEEQTGKWVYGYYGNISNDESVKHFIIPNGLLQWAYGYMHSINHDTLGQFTGLCDSKGIEIYEGDILQFKISEQGKESQFYLQKGVVLFRYGAFNCDSTNLPDWHSEFFPNGTIRLKNRMHVFHGMNANRNVYSIDFDAEIIGNIHENPELLNPNN